MYVMVEKRAGGHDVAYGPYATREEAEADKEKRPFTRATNSRQIVRLYTPDKV